jgi:FAD/FMN-containing dehydrogenase
MTTCERRNPALRRRDGTARTVTAYTAESYRRLRQAKATYDPSNIFSVNHNIPPARAAGISPPR